MTLQYAAVADHEGDGRPHNRHWLQAPRTALHVPAPPMPTLLIALLVALLLFAGAASAMVLVQMRRLRVVEPQVQPLLPQQVPEDTKERLAPGLDLLLSLGFAQPVAQRTVSQLLAGQLVDQFQLTLTHPKVPAAAFLTTTVLPDGPRQWTIHFVSRTREGHTLLTRNRASITGPLPLRDVTTHDVWLPDWPAVWKAHVAAMRVMAPRPAQWSGMTSEAWSRASADADRASFQVRQMHGQLVWAGDGGYRISARWALSMLGRAWMVAHHTWRPMAADRLAASKKVPPSLSAMVAAYEQHSRRHPSGGWSAGAKWLLFFASAAVAALSFGLNMDLQALAALLLVLLVHEGGHFLAMRQAGYQDLKVFFLPFLGAAVSGRHEQPTVRQELTVLFAGPLPGLVLGLVALLYVPADVLGEFGHACALLAVILNAFNLLPIHPLDGGKIFEILLLSRWPGLAFAGRVLGVLGLGALAWTMKGALAQGVMLGFVFLMALGLPQHWREARVARALRASGRHAGLARPAALKALFSTFSQLGYGRLAWPSQKALVDALLPATLRPRLTRPGRAAGLAFYAFSVALPLLGAVAWGLRMQQFGPDPGAQVQVSAEARAQAEAAGRAQLARWLVSRQAELQALQQRVSAAPDADTRWALLEPELDQVAEDLSRNSATALPAAETLLRMADALAAAPDAMPQRRSQAALWRADAEPDAGKRLNHLRAAMAAYEAQPPAAAVAEAAASASAAAASASGAALPTAPGVDMGPLLRATALWAQEAPADAEPMPADSVDKALARAGDTARPQDLTPLQAHKVDLLLTAGRRDEALDLANAVFDRALPRGDTALLAASAQLLVETTLAANGPEAALKALDTALPLLDVARSPGKTPAEPLRRFGLWVAEAAQRPDWQRQQVAKLAPPRAAAAPVSFTDRALIWLISRGQTEATTLLDVERAHWEGNAQAARDAARRMLDRNPRYVVQLWPANPRSPLAVARANVSNEVRRAVYRRYGLPVQVGA